MAEQRYRVIDRLEAGGMAEVFRGEAASVQGFKKQVAIKRVLPHLAQNKSFIRMFLDEARLGARLNHANIVTVFDIGAADKTYFIVMEFVDGGNLKAVMEVMKAQRKRLGVKETLYIAIEVCRGLSYAHELVDDEGEALNIVHRDISPPNILLTKRGEVKVTDFGLAKATTQLEKTDPGVVKGKFSYLSPEAASGNSVDHRADLFAVGIIIWECLAGKRLFLGDSDYDTVKSVQKAVVPSLVGTNPDVDDELQGILEKAMAREPGDRYQTALEMEDALTDYLYGHRLKVTSGDMGKLVRDVIAAKPKVASKRRRPEGSTIDKLIEEELLAITSLDDMSDPLDPNSGPHRTADLSRNSGAGAMPLDAGSFRNDMENPQDWFNEDEELEATAFFDRSSAPDLLAGGREETLSDPHDLAALLEDEGEKKNRASANDSQDLAALLEDEIQGSDVPEAEQPLDLSGKNVPKAPLTPSDLKPPDEQGADSAAPAAGAQAAAASSGGGGALKYVVVLLVLLVGAGAAAYFGKLL